MKVYIVVYNSGKFNNGPTKPVKAFDSLEKAEAWQKIYPSYYSIEVLEIE